MEPLDGLGSTAVRPFAAGGTRLKRGCLLGCLGFKPDAHLPRAASHHQAHAVVLRIRVGPGRRRLTLITSSARARIAGGIVTPPIPPGPPLRFPDDGRQDCTSRQSWGSA